MSKQDDVIAFVDDLEHLIERAEKLGLSQIVHFVRNGSPGASYDEKRSPQDDRLKRRAAAPAANRPPLTDKTEEDVRGLGFKRLSGERHRSSGQVPGGFASTLRSTHHG